MKTKSICPKCKSVLEFDRTAFSVVKCPKCNYTGKVADFKELEPETMPPPGPGAGNKFYKPGMLELIESDAQWLQQERLVILKRGMNTIGRKSPNSTATIQLPATDEYMSKNHASIEVIMKADGAFEHRLSDWNSKNGTFHKGERLEKGDVIKLMQGDTIKLGHTSFKLVTE